IDRAWPSVRRDGRADRAHAGERDAPARREVRPRDRVRGRRERRRDPFGARVVITNSSGASAPQRPEAPVVEPTAPRRSVTFVPADAYGVARIVIDRPDDPVNAIDVKLLEDLAAAIAQAREANPRGLVVASGELDHCRAGAV